MPHLIVIEGHEVSRRQLEELLTVLEKKGWPLMEKIEASSRGWGWPEALASVNSGGLFTSRRVVVIEEAEGLGLFDPSLNTLLEDRDAPGVLVAVFLSNSKKNFPKETLGLKKISFVRAEPSVSPWKRKDWLLALAREKKLKLEPAAASLLAESLESQEELRSELDKLALSSDGAPITLALAQELSFDEGARALLTFLDGVCQARPKDVARSLIHLRSTPSPLPVLTALYNRLRPALYLACFPQAERQALESIGATREYALRMARTAKKNFGPEAVKKFMLLLIRCSFLEKTSFAQGWPGFETLVWKLLSGSFRPNRASGRK